MPGPPAAPGACAGVSDRRAGRAGVSGRRAGRAGVSDRRAGDHRRGRPPPHPGTEPLWGTQGPLVLVLNRCRRLWGGASVTALAAPRGKGPRESTGGFHRAGLGLRDCRGRRVHVFRGRRDSGYGPQLTAFSSLFPPWFLSSSGLFAQILFNDTRNQCLSVEQPTVFMLSQTSSSLTF
ncbi:hypothetical protein Celaphus_00016838 [Cervus elaphus hippelaphus]|uniref:Uncharacterized protein n=1 Tax=Cervus elaphus hippelaphus TaxID=46360 RepID=A0A212C3W5_CEREH|nr:hypothetical protein Celaphus_00016838 [Cervus elaphus hippelaphus]